MPNITAQKWRKLATMGQPKAAPNRRFHRNLPISSAESYRRLFMEGRSPQPYKGGENRPILIEVDALTRNLPKVELAASWIFERAH